MDSIEGSGNVSLLKDQESLGEIDNWNFYGMDNKSKSLDGNIWGKIIIRKL